MHKVFVTGINGLLGMNLVNSLFECGFYVKGLIRNKSKYQGNLPSNFELIEGDLSANFSELLSDVDTVIHVAAITDQSLLTYEDYGRINENATIRLFHAAIKSNVKKFIFVSTANTMGNGRIDTPGHEDKVVREPFVSSFYAQSKKNAERYLLQHKGKTEVMVVNPTFMIGAHDTKPSSGKIILMGWKKKVIFYPPGGKNFVHVEDVAKGIIRCIEKGKNKEKYLLCNENLTYKDFYTKLNKITHQKPLMIKIPYCILITAGVFGDLLRSFKIKTSLSLTNMCILCSNNYYSNSKSINELGVEYQSTDKAIRIAIDYFSKSPLI